jgi:hypothetical protein
MAYTKIQTLRKMRARNKGLNQKVAKRLRSAAEMLEQIGPEELTRSEIRVLELASQTLVRRLNVNELTTKLAKVVDAMTQKGIK